MAQLLPMGRVMLVHRRTPAEHIVADEEIIQYANDNGNQRDAEENANFLIELVNRDFVRRRERRLNEIVEWSIPGVYRYPDFDHKPGDKDN